ncbi:unnamed protein product [Cochlearia groenlandica]
MSSDAVKCDFCGNVPSKISSCCKIVRYCSEECKNSDWESGHKLKCKSFLVVTDPSILDFKVSPVVLVPQMSQVKAALKPRDVPQMSQVKATVKPSDALFPYETFLEYFKWDKPVKSPCGLENCGNSCYTNVVLQCLSWTRPLCAYLLERGHKRECRGVGWCFFCEFETHHKFLDQSRFPFRPVNIISRLPTIGGNLVHGRQEDAHELMRFAIDRMQSVCLGEFGGQNLVDPRGKETTLIQYIFGGVLESQVQCTVCTNVSCKYENMMDLAVEIQGDVITLEQCLAKFTALEWLQGDNLYKCDRCNAYVKACKRLTISSAPNILTITLKRFQGGMFGKITKRISFPETFDLGPYVSSKDETSIVYKLYGVIVHLDELNSAVSGHYVSYVKNFRGNWYKINDSEVENVDPEDVLSTQAYMLLYSRVHARPWGIRSEEASQDSSVVSSEVRANSSSVSSFGTISRSNCRKKLSFVPVDLKGKEVGDSKTNNCTGMGHDSGTDHTEEEEEEPMVEDPPVDSTSSRASATEYKKVEKEALENEMVCDFSFL